MKFWLLQILSILIVISAFMGAGYWVGRNPSLMYYLAKFYHNEVILVVYPNDLLPSNIANNFQKHMNSPLKVIYAKNDDEFRSHLQSADMVLAAFQFVKNNELNEIAKTTLITQKIRSKEVNPDFLTQEILEYDNIPLFWKVSDHHLSIYSLFFTESSQAHKHVILNFIKLILKKEHILDWTRTIPYSSTISKIDESGLNPEKKPGYLRSFELKDMKSHIH